MSMDTRKKRTGQQEKGLALISVLPILFLAIASAVYVFENSFERSKDLTRLNESIEIKLLQNRISVAFPCSSSLNQAQTCNTLSTSSFGRWAIRCQGSDIVATKGNRSITIFLNYFQCLSMNDTLPSCSGGSCIPASDSVGGGFVCANQQAFVGVGASGAICRDNFFSISVVAPTVLCAGAKVPRGGFNKNTNSFYCDGQRGPDCNSELCQCQTLITNKDCRTAANCPAGSTLDPTTDQYGMTYCRYPHTMTGKTGCAQVSVGLPNLTIPNNIPPTPIWPYTPTPTPASCYMPSVPRPVSP